MHGFGYASGNTGVNVEQQGDYVDLSTLTISLPESVEPIQIFGVADAYLRLLEKTTQAEILVHDKTLTVRGEARDAERVVSALTQMIASVTAGSELTLHDVELIVARTSEPNLVHEIRSTKKLTIRTSATNTVQVKTEGQRKYVDAINAHTITFGLGPAGSGKTYLAMAMALSALRRKEIKRIILTRPVVEAGESLGFLPGTLEEKLDPYVRPLYDALFDLTDPEFAKSLIEQGIVEIAPLAFMRGRTLNDAYVILDEAQNTTAEQMKMFLTRLGFNSKFVVTGDGSQRDIKGFGGLESARRILSDVSDIAFIDLSTEDIVRHNLVAQIVQAYERQAKV